MSYSLRLLFLAVIQLLLFIQMSVSVRAQVPGIINYQGRVIVNGTNFDGIGLFKFAIVNANATKTYWSNGFGTISVDVSKGLYSVLLGDATVPNMASLPVSVFTNSDVRLRVWFDDGTHSLQQLEPDQRIAAVGFALMAGNVPDGLITSSKLANGAVGTKQLADGSITAAKIASGAIDSSRLAAGATKLNLQESGLSGISGGGVILSAEENATNLIAAGYIKAGRIILGEKEWRSGSTNNAPSRRYLHSAIWTGEEWILWGGTIDDEVSNAGSRYNPSTDSWTTMSTNNAPSPRKNHTAVWTGVEMLIWGGSERSGWFYDGNVNTGARYNPATDTWTPITTNNAPSARAGHSAVWSGTEMLIMGGDQNWCCGYGGSGEAPFQPLNTGARYNPATDEWTDINTNGAPATYSESSPWIGSEMFVGGRRYNPSTDTWTTNGVGLGYYNVAVWTGTELIILNRNAGYGESKGFRYNPETEAMTPLNKNGAPVVGTAVWSGREVIIFGDWQYMSDGLNTGSRYDPRDDSWIPTSSVGTIPEPVTMHSAVWTGSEMLMWGGRPSYTGEKYTLWRYTPPQPWYLYLKP